MYLFGIDLSIMLIYYENVPSLTNQLLISICLTVRNFQHLPVAQCTDILMIVNNSEVLS